MTGRALRTAASSNIGLQDRIAMRAYELFLAHGATDGHDLEDWLQAERELLAEASASRPREVSRPMRAKAAATA